MFQADESGTIVQASGRWHELMGTTAPDDQGTRWIDALHPQDRERVQRDWDMAVADGQPLDTEFRIPSPRQGDPPTNIRMQFRPALRGEPPRPGFIGVWAGT